MRTIRVKSKQSPVKGHIAWEKYDRSGKLVDNGEIDNVVTYDATDVWTALSVGLNVDDNKVSRLLVAEDGTIPDRTHSQMVDQIGSHVALSGYSFPEQGKVTYTFLLNYVSYANGYTMRSVGLSNVNNTIIAKQAIGALEKTEDFQFVFHWTLHFT